MDANNAINLLNETFQNEFDLNQYQKSYGNYLIHQILR